MADSQPLVPGSNPYGVTTAAVLAAVEHVLGLCAQSQEKEPDSAVAYAIRGLYAVREAVAYAWPLSAEVKGQTNLGAFAAKNLYDWNKDVAGALMTLDYVLKNDGLFIERLG
jgi:hypothetical protein